MANKDRKERTKERILLTALQLFSEKGYLGTTTKEISAKAGVAEVTLFRYFVTKEQLFEEVLKRFSFLQKIKEILPQVEGLPPEEALFLIAQAFLERLRERKPLILILHSELNLYPEKVKDILKGVILSIRGEFIQYLQTLRKRGFLKEEVDLPVCAQAFLGMIFSYFYLKDIKGLSLEDELSEELTLRSFVKIFLEGVKA